MERKNEENINSAYPFKLVTYLSHFRNSSASIHGFVDDVVEVAVGLAGNVVVASVPLAGGIGDDFLDVAQVGEKLARSISW